MGWRTPVCFTQTLPDDVCETLTRLTHHCGAVLAVVHHIVHMFRRRRPVAHQGAPHAPQGCLWQDSVNHTIKGSRLTKDDVGPVMQCIGIGQVSVKSCTNTDVWCIGQSACELRAPRYRILSRAGPSRAKAAVTCSTCLHRRCHQPHCCRHTAACIVPLDFRSVLQLT